MSELADDWSQFNVAMAGATAALAGLLIVAMSVNLKAIVALVLALTAGAFGLVPGQVPLAYGLEVFVATVLAGVFQWHAIRVVMREDRVSTRDRVLKSIAGVMPIVAFLLGSVLVVAGIVEAGLIAMAVGSVLSIIAALLMAWVVLVEVLR